MWRHRHRYRHRSVLSLSLTVLCSFCLRTAEGWDLPTPAPGCTTSAVDNRNQNVDGTIPTEFGYCTQMASFELNNNDITGPIPTQVR
mmetsp:Transcript_108719/g.316350  ORF Transcript_108719/g.316350 Transcript_108719/m.316350 type:complete len:87 (-) Transcript_108719:118-378(-)